MTPLERQELRAFGERLLAIANGARGESEDSHITPLVVAAQREIRRRSVRMRMDKNEKIGEVGWAILFDLYVMEALGRRVSKSSACIASGVPPTTALRYIDSLIAQDLISSESDAEDARRSLLRLNLTGKQLVEHTLCKSTDAELAHPSAENPRALGQSHVNPASSAIGAGNDIWIAHRENARGGPVT